MVVLSISLLINIQLNAGWRQWTSPKEWKEWYTNKKKPTEEQTGKGVPLPQADEPFSLKETIKADEKLSPEQKKIIDERWNNTRNEITEATKKIIKKLQENLETLQKKLKENQIELFDIKRKTITEYKQAEPMKNFKDKSPITFDFLQKLFDESIGIGKIVEIRSIVTSEDFSDFKNNIQSIKRTILSIVDQIYETNKTENINDEDALINARSNLLEALTKMLGEWKSFETKIKKICKKNKIFFSQDGKDGQTYLQEKLKKLEKTAKEAKKRIEDLNNVALETIIPGIINGIDQITESFKNQWGFYTTMPKLKKSILASYQSAEKGIKTSVKSIENIDIQSSGFEKIEDDLFGLM